jgi:tRNA methyltransferase complex GCD14 subunit
MKASFSSRYATNYYYDGICSVICVPSISQHGRSLFRGMHLSNIKAGDVAIIYERFDEITSVSVRDDGEYSNKWGTFRMQVSCALSCCPRRNFQKHNIICALQDWIGLPYGSKVQSRTGDGWLYLLAPTPELWTLVLRHRTQILYLADISAVCLQLELRPGCIGMPVTANAIYPYWRSMPRNVLSQC